MEGTAEVRDVHRFDVAALERYLRERIAGFAGPLTVRQFRGGQSNPTYYLAAGGREYVLRRKPPGKLLPSAHAVDREYRVLAALASHTSVPVPKPYVLCEDEGVIGTIFYVMDCVHGRIFRDANLPGATRAERTAIYDSMNDVLARLHTVDWQKIGLAEFGRPGNYYARQIHRWSQQYRASETEKIEALNAHPPIGARNGSARSIREQGSDEDPVLITALGRLNKTYEQKFGFRFVVFVNQRPRSEILHVLRERLQNRRDDELATGLDELVAIALDRWLTR